MKNKKEMLFFYNYYLRVISEESVKVYCEMSHYEGVTHGLGIALNYDFDKVQQDIKEAILKQEVVNT